ncbi:hypothetical protein HDU93_005681 [Gonapodya sp. JEL0774]|nr:hypothetical protein HDU93_005681 [Gonapodya sp. JEL0774]
MNYFLEEENGPSLEREFRSFYGLPPDQFALPGPASLAPLKDESNEEEADSNTWDTLRLGMATLISYYSLRSVIFLKLAPEKSLPECHNVLREIRFLLTHPRFGTGTTLNSTHSSPVTSIAASPAARLGDLKFPLWTPSLAWAVEQIVQHEGLSSAMEDVQLVLEVLDCIAGHGWGIARQLSKRLVGGVMVQFGCKVKESVEADRAAAEKLVEDTMFGELVAV